MVRNVSQHNITAWPYKDLLLADALTLTSSKGGTIPYAANGPVKFLGMEIHILHDTANAKEDPINDLKQMLYRVDACPLTKHQKLYL